MENRRQSRELGEKVRVMTETADREIEATRVNFRWGRKQLATVKLAAEILGVPYQTYIKQVIFKQAVADIRDAEMFKPDAGSHRVPMLAGPDEDHIIRQRIGQPERRVDGSSFLAELVEAAHERVSRASRRR